MCKEQQIIQVTCELCVTFGNHHLNICQHVMLFSVADMREFLILEAMDKTVVVYAPSRNNHSWMNRSGTSPTIFCSAYKWLYLSLNKWIIPNIDVPEVSSKTSMSVWFQCLGEPHSMWELPVLEEVVLVFLCTLIQRTLLYLIDEVRV